MNQQPTRKRLAIAFALTLALVAGVIGQTRLRSRGAMVSVTDGGAIAITPATGQATTITGPATVTGAATLSSTAATAGAATFASTVGVTGVTTMTGGAKVSATGVTLTGILSGSASLDFGATAAGACDLLTIAVTGAVDGNPVSLGIPAALMTSTAYQFFEAYVSAADVVTVKRCNPINATTPLDDPAAATVKLLVFKF